MYEEWLEKIAKKLEIKRIKQTNTLIELSISKEVSNKIDGEKLFYTAYEISPNFKLKFSDGSIHIILSFANLKEHFIKYIIKLLSKICEENNL